MMARFIDRAGRDRDRHVEDLDDELGDDELELDDDQLGDDRLGDDELGDSIPLDQGAVIEDETSSSRPPSRHLAPAVAAVALAIAGVVCLAPLVLPEHETAVPAKAASSAVGARQDSPPPTVTPEGPVSGPVMAAAPPAIAASSAVVSPAAPSAAAPEDLLAGPVSDQVLQDLLLDSLPADRTITDSALLESSDGRALLAAAWAGLAQDVQAGGWMQPRRQACAVMRRGRDDAQHHLPVVVDVMIMWAATSSSGDPTERELSQVHMNRGSGSWTVSGITTAGEH